MDIITFKKQAKEVCLKYGFKKSQVSIRTDNGWIFIKSKIINKPIPKECENEIIKLPDCENGYWTKIRNSGGGEYEDFLFNVK